jgi:hypothetical protein
VPRAAPDFQALRTAALPAWPEMNDVGSLIVEAVEKIFRGGRPPVGDLDQIPVGGLPHVMIVPIAHYENRYDLLPGRDSDHAVTSSWECRTRRLECVY